MLPDTPYFLAYWRNARSRTVRVLETLAPEDLEWAPTPGTFSFGDLFRHLAGLARFKVAENVQGRPSRYQGPLWPHRTGTRRPIHQKKADFSHG